MVTHPTAEVHATAVIEPYPIAFLIDFLNGNKPNLRELGGPEILSSIRFETILVLTLAVNLSIMAAALGQG